MRKVAVEINTSKWRGQATVSGEKWLHNQPDGDRKLPANQQKSEKFNSCEKRGA